MFINFSNHPSARWNKEQRQAANVFGDIRDIPFPAVSATAATDEIACLAERYVREILCLHPDCVMCQGEFSLTFAVVCRLQIAGIRCVCACSERKVVEKLTPDGVIQKTSVFEFRQFREYENHCKIGQRS